MVSRIPDITGARERLYTLVDSGGGIGLWFVEDIDELIFIQKRSG